MKLQWDVLPKQMEYLKSTSPELLYSGAFRAGKTRALCMKLVMRASVPGARELLCRKTLSSLKGSTLMTLLEPEGMLPPVLPPGSYTHNRIDRTIRIHGGGMIQYFGVRDSEQIGSYAGTGVAVDEAVDLNEKDLTYLRGRKSIDVPGLPRQFYAACNPGPPTHPLAIWFGLRRGGIPLPGFEATHTTSYDNYFLPKDYLESLESLRGTYFSRYVLGEWVGGEGVIFDRFSNELHKVPTADWVRLSGEGRTILAIDDGYTNPFCCLKILVDGDGRMHIARQFYKRGMLMQSKVQAVLAMGGRESEVCLVDPSAAALIAELANNGIPVRAADNVVLDGIYRMQERLHVQGDGRPRLTVDPACTDVLHEFGSYEWRKGKDGDYQEVPVKAYDHAMDPTRYTATYLDAYSGPLFL